MPDAPWKDALKRARNPVVSPTRTADATAADAAADPAALSPELARLLEERRALEARMVALTGMAAEDPRYAVAPLSQRRAELARWGDARDAGRAAVVARRPPPDAPADRLPGRLSDRQPDRPSARTVDPYASAPGPRPTPGETVRGTPGETVRATPGELLPGSRPVSRSPQPFERAPPPPRDSEPSPVRRGDEARRDLSARAAAAAGGGRALSDAGRALRAPEDRARNGQGDPLDRRLERARDLVSRSRRAYVAAERALDSARDAIPRAWEERARERIPGLGRADPYVRETARKLSVAVGTIDDLTAKAERMRDMARDARDLRDADAANDDARRDRALDRLKARRSDDGRASRDASGGGD